MNSTTDHEPHPKWKSCIKSLVLFFAVLLVLTIALCRPIHYSSEISGHVIETSNGAPVDGAVVVAAWYLTGMEGAHAGTLAVQEAITAADGSFTIDSWGPKFTKPAVFVGLHSDMPKLFVFKNGFLPTFVENVGSGPPYRFHGPQNLALRVLDEKVIPIEPFSGGLGEYLPYLDALNSRINVLRAGPNCEWKQIPQLILTLDAVAQVATRHGLEGGASLTKITIPPRDCGNVSEFFGIVDDDLVPCENRMECLKVIESYTGPPEEFLLPISYWVQMRGDGIIDAIQLRGWELDGFEARVGYRVYRVRSAQED